MSYNTELLYSISLYEFNVSMWYFADSTKPYHFWDGMAVNVYTVYKLSK